MPTTRVDDSTLQMHPVGRTARRYRRSSRFYTEAIFVLVFALVVAIKALTGTMQPWVTPDTAGYLAIPSCPACLAGARFPLYGWAVQALHGVPHGFAAIPWLQAALYGLAAVDFLWAVQNPAFCMKSRTALAITLGCSNVLLIWTSALNPTLPGIAALVAALAEIVRLAAGRSRRLAALVRFALFQCLAWLLWPGLIGFVIVSPLLLLALARGVPGVRRGALAAAVLAAGLVPGLLVASVRWQATGDFNISAFGGFQMSGMASLMLTPDVAARLPDRDRPLADAILAARSDLEKQGKAIATPQNSTGQRSFVSEAVGYFDILARTHDDVLYGAVARQQQPGESWIAFNRRLQRYAVDTIGADKRGYAAWIVGALTRAVGHLAVTTPAFFASTVLLALIVAFRGYAASTRTTSPSGLLQTVIWTTAGALAPAILVTFPALRYLDVASLLLPAIPIYVLIGQLRRAPPPAPADLALPGS